MKKTLIVGAAILGALGVLACNGNDPVIPKGHSGEIRLHALSTRGPDTKDAPADFTWTINGGPVNKKHFRNLGQFSGSTVTIPWTGTATPHVHLTVTTRGEVDCDITVPGHNMVEKSGHNTCTVTYP